MSAPTCQMRLSRSSLHLNEPVRGISRICNTARTWLNSNGRLTSTLSIRTKRKPVGPTNCLPNQGSVTTWSRMAWLLPAFCAPPSSDIASEADSPKRTRTCRSASGSGVRVVNTSMPPCSSRPKSSNTPAGALDEEVSSQGGCGSFSTACPALGAMSALAFFTPASLCQTMRVGATKNEEIGERSA